MKKFKYILLYLLIALLTPSLQTTSPVVNVPENTAQEQVEKKQEKPAWRKNIYKWAGIATGVAAAVAGAAWLFFHQPRLDTGMPGPQFYDEQTIQTAIANAKSTKDLIAIKQVPYKGDPSKRQLDLQVRQTELAIITMKGKTDAETKENIKHQLLKSIEKSGSQEVLNFYHGWLRVQDPIFQEAFNDPEVKAAILAKTNPKK